MPKRLIEGRFFVQGRVWDCNDSAPEGSEPARTGPWYRYVEKSARSQVQSRSGRSRQIFCSFRLRNVLRLRNR